MGRFSRSMHKKTKFTPLKITLREIFTSLPMSEIERTFEEFYNERMYEDYGTTEDYAEAIRILLIQPIAEGCEELT